MSGPVHTCQADDAVKKKKKEKKERRHLDGGDMRPRSERMSIHVFGVNWDSNN